MNTKLESLTLASMRWGETPSSPEILRLADKIKPPSRHSTKRLAREWHTIEIMVRIYCRDHHQKDGLCPECQSLLDYASLRLDRCRFGTEKPTCAKCPVHCYQKNRREQVRAVMRYAGPRMLWEHPLLSLRHWLDGLRSRRRQSASSS